MGADLDLTKAAVVMRRRVADVLAQPDRSPWYERPLPKSLLVLTWLYGSLAALSLGRWSLPTTVALTVSLGLATAAGVLAVGHTTTHRRTFGPGRTSWLVGEVASVGITGAWWRQAHNIVHHGGVPDGGRAGEGAVDGAPFARLDPTQPWHPWYRAQPVYVYAAFPLYYAGLVAGSLVFALTGRVHGRRVVRPTPRHVLTQLGDQFGLVALAVALALLQHGWLGTAVVAGSTLGIAGIGTALVLAVELVHHGRAALPGATGSAAWAQWQADVSMSISTRSRVLRWYSGGLTFHTEHHFFPKAPMQRLAEVQVVVRRTYAEYDLPYHEYPGFVASWQAFHAYLKELAVAPAGAAP